MSKILLKNCNLISMDEHQPQIIYNVDILIVNDKIAKIQKKITEKVEKIINCTNKFVMPGLINCHTHIPMSIFKESANGYGLQDWLEKIIFPVENKLVHSTVYESTLYGMYESINNGVTCINDMYFFSESIIKSAKKTKLGYIGNDTLLDIDNGGERRLTSILNNLKKYPKFCNIIPIHGLYTCTKNYVDKVVKAAIKYNLPIHMHFCENDQEILTIEKIHKMSPINVIKKSFAGVSSLILAHCVKLDGESINYLGKIKANAVHCPTSNLRLGCGIADITKYIANGINVCIGTDGSGSGSNGNLFKEVKLACMLQKGKYADPKAMDAYDGLKLATVNGAIALNKNKGIIAPNKDADIIIIDLYNNFQTVPFIDPISNIVYNVSSENIMTVIIGGKIVKDNYKIVGINFANIVKKCFELKDKLFSNK